MGWTELLAWSLHTSGLLCCFLACPPPPPPAAAGGHLGSYWYAICFQNHRDCNKPYTKHCSVLSWRRAQRGGPSSLGLSSLRGAASYMAFGLSFFHGLTLVLFASGSFYSLLAPSFAGFLLASRSANFLNMLAYTLRSRSLCSFAFLWHMEICRRAALF